MKYLPHPVFFIFAALLALGGCKSATHVTETGPDTYSITYVPNSGMERNTDFIEGEAKDAAQKYCDEHGKTLKILSLTHKKPLILTGYVTATIEFQALNPGDPRLNEPVAPVAASAPSMGYAQGGAQAAPQASGAPAPAVSTQITGDMYTQLLKLDDLRKRGILTQEEFDAEKKKILARDQ